MKHLYGSETISMKRILRWKNGIFFRPSEVQLEKDKNMFLNVFKCFYMFLIYFF
jgi:hypothetical protein